MLAGAGRHSVMVLRLARWPAGISRSALARVRTKPKPPMFRRRL